MGSEITLQHALLQCAPFLARLQLSGRRLQNHGGVVHAKGLIKAPMPSWVEGLCRRLGDAFATDLYGGAPPNHVLINAYQPGEGTSYCMHNFLSRYHSHV